MFHSIILAITNAAGKSSDADLGKPVRAIANGEVVKISALNKLGYLIALKHTASPESSFCIKAKSGHENEQFFRYSSEDVSSIYSIYLHLDNIKVILDDCVDKGQIIGYIMDPGGGPHLHFEIRKTETKNSNNWSLVGESTNWAYKDGTPTGYYLNVQEMVDSGLRDPSDFINNNKKLGVRKCGEQRYSKKGLYYESRMLTKTAFEFISRPMAGIKINHYADGNYIVSTSPNSIMKIKSFTFYLVPNRPVTFGGADEWTGTVFEVKRGLHIYKVRDDGLFVTVNDGRKEGQDINYNVSTLSDNVITRHEGLIQHRVQLLKIDVNLSKGKYVFFEGEGNVFDKETYPKKEQGCWYIEVVDN
jgi:murein DD-endopeptidase MepM/ murein hydrolase activator NlpD